MTNENLEKAAEKIEITLSMSHKNGSRWAVEEVFKDGRRGFHYDFAELKQQLSAIQGPVKLEEPAVVRDYIQLKSLVDEHNKQYENKSPEKQNAKQI